MPDIARLRPKYSGDGTRLMAVLALLKLVAFHAYDRSVSLESGSSCINAPPHALD
jgi:hypothetical protein